MLANEPKSAIQTVSIADLEEQRPYKSTTGFTGWRLKTDLATTGWP